MWMRRGVDHHINSFPCCARAHVPTTNTHHKHTQPKTPHLAQALDRRVEVDVGVVVDLRQEAAQLGERRLDAQRALAGKALDRLDQLVDRLALAVRPARDAFVFVCCFGVCVFVFV